MASPVTERFIKCHNYLKENSFIKSSAKFAEALGIKKQSLNEILKSRREVSVDVIGLSVEIFHFNPEYLLMGKGDYLKDPNEESYLNNNITYIPYKAQAGYIDQYSDEQWLETLDTFRLPAPQLREGEFRCFEIEGDSMEPFYNDGDYVICSRVDMNYLGNYLKNNMVYIVVTEDGIVLKQLAIDVVNSRVLELVSFNKSYPDQTIKLRNVKEIWKVHMKLTSTDLMGNGEVNKLEEVSSELADLKAMVAKLVN